MVRNTCGREIWLEQFRLDVRSAREPLHDPAPRDARRTPVAQPPLLHGRGRGRRRPARDGGPPRAARGRSRGAHRRDRALRRGRPDAAHAELDARFAAGEAAAHPPPRVAAPATLRAFAARDWDAMRALCAPTRRHDHRLVGWGTLAGAAASQNFARWSSSRRTRASASITCASASAACSSRRLVRHARGRRLREPVVVGVELDALGLGRASSIYDPEQLEQALARFAELPRARAAARSFENAATRAVTQMSGRRPRARLAGLRRLIAPDRSASTTPPARGSSSSIARVLGYVRSSPRSTLDADRSRCSRRAASGWRSYAAHRLAGGDIGPSEMRDLLLYRGRRRAGGRIARRALRPDDVDAAYAELDARLGGRRGRAARAAWMRASRGALAARDWDACARSCAPGARRRTITGSSAGDAARSCGFLERCGRWSSSRPTPDASRSPRTSRRGVPLGQASGWEPATAAPSRSPTWGSSSSTTKAGRCASTSTSPGSTSTEALARFEALRPDPLRIPPNTATRTRRASGALAQSGRLATPSRRTSTIATKTGDVCCSVSGGSRRALVALESSSAEGWRPSRTRSSPPRAIASRWHRAVWRDTAEARAAPRSRSSPGRGGCRGAHRPIRNSTPTTAPRRAELLERHVPGEGAAGRNRVVEYVARR